jgi:hypothetical protein
MFLKLKGFLFKTVAFIVSLPYLSWKGDLKKASGCNIVYIPSISLAFHNLLKEILKESERVCFCA